MLKRLAILVAVFLFMTVINILPVCADTTANIPTTVSESMAMSSASDAGIPSVNRNNDPLNYIPPPSALQIAIKGVTYSYGYLTYGQSNGDFSGGHYRYAGYDYEGEPETNLAFPPDVNANGAAFTAQAWMQYPWLNNNSQQTGAIETPWDSDTTYTDDLLYGILYSIGAAGNPNVNGYTLSYSDAGNPLWANITDYAHILMPPTKYTWGIARMWHIRDGNLLYVTIPMPPTILAPLIQGTPALVVTPQQATVHVGGTVQYQAEYYPADWIIQGKQDVTTEAAWSSSETSIAAVGYGTGLATGQSGGSATIAASYADLTGQGTLTVEQPAPAPPPQSGNFTLQAISQIQHDLGIPDGTPAPSGVVSNPYVGMVQPVRPPGTAEWTDYVTGTVTPPTQSQVGSGDRGSYYEPTDGATIAPPEPGQAPGPGVVPPLAGELIGSYSIMDSYCVTDGSLIYPLMSSDYSWGNPAPPEGTTTTPMTPMSSGHSAAGTFRENWAHDGAPVIDLTGNKVAQYPKDYNITVQYHYTVNYHEEYDYRIIDTLTDTVVGEKTVFVNGLQYSPRQPLQMSTQLKVDGTGALY